MKGRVQSVRVRPRRKGRTVTVPPPSATTTSLCLRVNFAQSAAAPSSDVPDVRVRRPSDRSVSLSPANSSVSPLDGRARAKRKRMRSAFSLFPSFCTSPFVLLFCAHDVMCVHARRLTHFSALTSCEDSKDEEDGKGRERLLMRRARQSCSSGHGS